MKKIKVKASVEFELNLKDGEKLGTHSFMDFKATFKQIAYDLDGYFHAYHRDYDTDIIPVNVKVKVNKHLYW